MTWVQELTSTHRSPTTLHLPWWWVSSLAPVMAFCGNGGPKVVLVENASRFARDLIVQLTGYEMMNKALRCVSTVDASVGRSNFPADLAASRRIDNGSDPSR